jgi:hypothetical protein
MTLTPESPSDLMWWADSVANIMHRKGIRDRNHLAQVIGMPKSTVYRTFDRHWGGEATAGVSARVAAVLTVPLNQLVVEPAPEFRRPQRCPMTP